MYSEFNTLEAGQYTDEPWFAANQPVLRSVACQTGTEVIDANEIRPAMIKIDVEGAEEKVITGLMDYLRIADPVVVMEFANDVRGGNINHKNAELKLISLGYTPHLIDADGCLQKANESTDEYITRSGLESDNIVYIKTP